MNPEASRWERLRGSYWTWRQQRAGLRWHASFAFHALPLPHAGVYLDREAEGTRLTVSASLGDLLGDPVASAELSGFPPPRVVELIERFTPEFLLRKMY